MPACDTCYRRKVRCDADFVRPCANCARHGTSCTFDLASIHRTKRRTRKHNPPHKSSPAAAETAVIIASGAHTDGQHPTDVSRAGQSARAIEASPQEVVDLEEDAYEQSLAETAFTQFYHHGINASKWTVFHDAAHLRIAYLGTNISNISHLVAQETQSTLARQRSNPVLSPFPSIRPMRPWKPALDSPLIRWYRSSFAEDISSLPPKEISDDLVDAFFSKVHPGFPIIDEAEFRAWYNNPANPPPLLLLNAVFLVGSHVSDHPQIKSRRSLMKISFFRRAKALFDMHHENDRLNLVQAAMMFTWHLQGADDVSMNAYYWVGVACRIAFGLGMHRDTSQAGDTSGMPDVDRRIWRRVWWTLYQLDALCSLHHGRPVSIDPDECDQAPLQAGDFVERDSLMNRKIHVDFCIQNSALCSIVVSVLKFSSPASTRRFRESPTLFTESQSRLDDRLVAWYFQLPKRFSTTLKESKCFWDHLLLAHYKLVLLHLHRIPDPSWTDKPSLDVRAKDTCHISALALVEFLETTVSQGWTGQNWFTCQTTLFAAALQISYETRAAICSGSIVLAIDAQSRLDHLITLADAVARHWPTAESIRQVYCDLKAKFKKQIEHSSSSMWAVDRAPGDQRQQASDDAASTGPLQADQVYDGQFVSLLDEHNWTTLFGSGETDDFLDPLPDDADLWSQGPVVLDR